MLSSCIHRAYSEECGAVHRRDPYSPVRGHKKTPRIAPRVLNQHGSTLIFHSNAGLTGASVRTYAFPAAPSEIPAAVERSFLVRQLRSGVVRTCSARFQPVARFSFKTGGRSRSPSLLLNENIIALNRVKSRGISRIFRIDYEDGLVVKSAKNGREFSHEKESG